MAADYTIGVPDAISKLSLGEESRPEATQAPSLHTKGVVAVDITEKFTTAVSTLKPGELVKDGFFTLFESVGALEIMDPKMDSGCVKEGDEFEELYDVSQRLLPEEVLGIIDQLLCHEMSWHLGYPLSQTVFTSVYVESLLMPNPMNIEQAQFVRRQDAEANQEPMLQVLRAYCLGMIKACGYVNQRVQSEHSYEEEDFVTNTYNRMLLSSVPTAAIRKAIRGARDVLKSLHGSIDGEILDALDCRLSLRDIFLSATECPQHVKEPEKARQPWKEGIVMLPGLKASHHLVKPVDESFSAKLQRKLASTVPPRPIVELSFDDAFGHLTRLFADGLEVIGVLDYTDPQCLQTFVSIFQAKKPQPLVYVRTLLQTFLFDAMEVLGSMSIRQILDDDFSIITLPASSWLDRINDEVEAPQDPRFTIAQQMELFRQRAAQPFLDILRTFCQNRCRVRRTLCHNVRAWDNLQLDAEDVDQAVHDKFVEMNAKARQKGREGEEPYDLPLSSWTYLYKLRQMEWIVQLGFELEVYQPDELGGMYWYLNYLSKSRLQHTQRIKTVTLRRIEEAGGPTADSGQFQRSLTYVRLCLLDSAVTWELSDALSCFYGVLLRLKLIKVPPRPYSNDELRYELRMKPFAPIALPELPTFDEFTAGTSQENNSVDEILAYAEKAAAGAKRGLELLSKMTPGESFSVGSHAAWATSVKRGLRSCIALGLGISTLQKAIRAPGRAEDEQLNVKVEVPTPDHAYHEWWIVPRISPAR